MMRAIAGLLIAFALLQMPVAAQDVGRPDVRRLPVPSVTIYPGDLIAGDLLVERNFYTTSSSRAAVLTRAGDLVGKVSRRTLLAGEPVPVNAVREPYAVVQGQSVVVVLDSPGLTITGRATTLQSGAVGEIVGLRNVDGGGALKGVVLPDGSIRVDRK